MKDKKESIIAAGGGQRIGNALHQLSYSGEIAIDQIGTIYVAGFNNH